MGVIDSVRLCVVAFCPVPGEDAVGWVLFCGEVVVVFKPLLNGGVADAVALLDGTVGRVMVCVIWSEREESVASAVLVGEEKGQWGGAEVEVSVPEEVGPGPWYGAEDG